MDHLADTKVAVGLLHSKQKNPNKLLEGLRLVMFVYDYI